MKRTNQGVREALEARRLFPKIERAAVLWPITALILIMTFVGLAWADQGEAYRASYQAEAEGRYADALDALDALKTDERGYFYQLRSGWLLYYSGSYESSISSYAKASELEPDSVEALVGKTLPQMALRLWEDTLETCDEVLKIDGESYLAISRKAWSLYSLGRYSEAEESYRQVLRLYPSDGEMMTGLGWALYMQGDLKGARVAFEDVLSRFPDHESATQGVAALGG